MVVDRLATRWGIRPRSDGDERFCVWYELAGFGGAES